MSNAKPILTAQVDHVAWLQDRERQALKIFVIYWGVSESQWGKNEMAFIAGSEIDTCGCNGNSC